ncbi:MAG: hypothetical protein NVSMB47_15880 [Polyangiales bacterium]
MRPRIPQISPLALAALCSALVVSRSAPASAARSLDDYRHFRALTIDLVGRMPTRAEIVTFEDPAFDLDRWIVGHLDSDAYVERLTRIYMDQLRLEISPAFNFTPPATTLRRVQLKGPKGEPIYVFYRYGQRRARPTTDGEFCMSAQETGVWVQPNNQPLEGSPVEIDAKVLEANTVLVKPWWLYRDYRSPAPVLRFGDAWTTADPAYRPVDSLLVEPDGKPTLSVRVCKEEAQTGELGTVYASGRDKPEPADKYGRKRPLAADDPYAKNHKGESISCRSSAATNMSIDCGCGVGLEHCMPGDGNGNEPRAFMIPTRMPLGMETPLQASAQPESSWHKLWWSQEAVHDFEHLFGEDRDFREVLTGKGTWVNGPLAQFYSSTAPATCCGPAKAFGLIEETEPLFDPKAVPTKLAPHDVDVWERVADRGPHAAGILTTPAFLIKFASRRARGAALYNTFLCKSFVSGNVMLQPSTEPNLMKRDGCSTCHATLEPLAAYFSRIVETDWTYLPSAQFPLTNDRCKKNPQGKFPGFCNNYYDPAFSDDKAGMLRGAYASLEHAEAGPIGAATAIAASPAFAQCAVERVASSFLGREVGADDQAMLDELTRTFVDGGYRMKGLVRKLLQSSAYGHANNLSSTAWRSAVGAPSAAPSGGGK